MILLTGVEFDRCRDWIKMKNRSGASWEELRLACKASREDLQHFIASRIDEDNWPTVLTPELWGDLVNMLEDEEKKRIQIQSISRNAELHDTRNENNRVFVPEGEKSAWQLYKKHLKEDNHFSDDAIQNIEDSSIGILKRLSTDTVDTGPIKGLVIGNVQSGKTANMAALMAMAADWRWNMFIVLSGTIESLRKQTQNRLHSDLNHPGNLVWTQFDHLSKRYSPPGQRLCDLQLQPDSNMRYMTVCLKLKSRLEDLIEWIEADQQNIKNLRVLVIDDEADQAGINTGDVYTDSERKTINRLILNLVHCRNKKAVSDADNSYRSHYQAMNYISYTATPYANCLNERGPETLYPQNFIRTLANSKSYFGPAKFFGLSDADNDQHMDVVRRIPAEDVNVISSIHNGVSIEIPESLKDSLRWFLCAAAVMRYYNYKKPVSMLIHTSQKQDHHEYIAKAVRKWLKSDESEIISACSKKYDEEKEIFTLRALREVYPDYEHDDLEIWDYPDFNDIACFIRELLNRITYIMMDDEGELQYSRGIHLCIDNCSKNGRTEDGVHMRLAYPDSKSATKPDYATAFMVVGGNTLSRGLTLEGLVSTYFLRSVKQADTLMQMGRWFGYRPHYELLQRVWLTDDTKQKFELLADIDNDLREQIYQMQVAGKTPEDFRIALLTSPKANWLSLTAKNKMQEATPSEIDFSGMDTQLTVYSKDPEEQKNNISIAQKFIQGLSEYEYKRSHKQSSDAYIWMNIPFSYIYDNFFKKGFRVPETSRAFQYIDLLCEWVDKQSENGEMTNWNVLLCGTKITDQTAENKLWNPTKGIKIGKINRSCKYSREDSVNIGVLSGKKDYLADIFPEMLGQEKWNEMISNKNITNEYRDYRKLAGVDKVPLFLIYVIDKDSSPVQEKAKSTGRTPLSVENDLIGITMVTPGIRGAKATRLTIKRPEDEAEVEG